MTMRPSIYEWYGRHPDLLDGLTTEEVAWLLGEGVTPPESLKDWDESEHPRVPAGSGDSSGEWTSGGGKGGDDDNFEADQNASQRIKKFTRSSSVNLRGLSVRMQRRIAKGFEQAYAAYPKLGPLGGVYVSRNLDTGTQAQWKPGDRIAFSPFELESVERFEHDVTQGKDAETYWRQAKDKLGPGVAKDRLVKLVERSSRYGPPEFSRSSVEGVVMHELGHHAEVRLRNNKDFRAAQAAWRLADELEGGVYSVSVYGERNFGEHVAECFSLSHIAPALVEQSTGGRSLLKAFATLR